VTKVHVVKRDKKKINFLKELGWPRSASQAKYRLSSSAQESAVFTVAAT
jgi:hypothetical protein